VLRVFLVHTIIGGDFVPLFIFVMHLACRFRVESQAKYFAWVDLIIVLL
jgi:hypothetical protein